MPIELPMAPGALLRAIICQFDAARLRAYWKEDGIHLLSGSDDESSL